jgi:ketosteroid isomerase-like protein
MTSPIEAVRALYESLSGGKHGESLRAHFTADAQTTEHPNLIKPEGARSQLDAMLAASAAGAGLLARQTYEVRSAVEIGSTVIVRLTWSGVIARDVGNFREGQVLTAHIAQFVETRDGRIEAIETYDCYEPIV